MTLRGQLRRQGREIEELRRGRRLHHLLVDDDCRSGIRPRHLRLGVEDRLLGVGVHHPVLVTEAVLIAHHLDVGVVSLELIADQQQHRRLQTPLTQQRAGLAHRSGGRSRELHRSQIPGAAHLGHAVLAEGAERGDRLALAEALLQRRHRLVEEAHPLQRLLALVAELADDVAPDRPTLTGRVDIGGADDHIGPSHRLTDLTTLLGRVLDRTVRPREPREVPRQVRQVPAGHLRPLGLSGRVLELLNRLGNELVEVTTGIDDLIVDALERPSAPAQGLLEGPCRARLLRD